MRLFAAIAFVLLTIGCQENKFQIVKNDNIDAKTKEEIRKLNEKVYAALRTNDFETYEAVKSPLKKSEDPAEVRKFLSTVANDSLPATYEIMEEFYVSSASIEKSHKLELETLEKDKYTFEFTNFTQEYFIALLKCKRNIKDDLLVLQYGKYEDGWRLIGIGLGIYSVLSKTAPELYREAKKKYEKGYKIDALNLLNSAKSCLKPAPALWTYNINDEILNSAEKLKNDIESQYSQPSPYVLEEVESKPHLINFGEEVNSEGVFPFVLYYSSLNPKDSLQLKKENSQVHSIIGKVFPGIDKDKKYIYYKVVFDKSHSFKKPDYEFRVNLQE